MSDTSGNSDASGKADRPGPYGGAAVRPAPVALDQPGTAAALEWYRASAWRWFAGGAAALCSTVVGAVFFTGWSVIPVLGGLGGALLLGGAAVRHQARRMRRVLGTRPWTAHSSVALQRGMSGAAVVLGGPSAGELLPLTPHAAQWRFPLLNGPAGVLWWCGDARTGGVLAPPGGTALIWARPVRGRRARTLAAGPQAAGLHGRPAPRQPQGAPDDAAGPARATAAPAVAASAMAMAARSTAPRRRRPWWRGTFRWVVVVGCLLMALATSWSVASENDPLVDLTVTGDSADGRCLVRWTDPFDGRTRTGPFHCEGPRGPVEGWETGFVVSYGPFKGDLYDSELRGTSAVTATDTAGLGGLALAAVGLFGGVTRLVVSARRWREKRDAALYAPTAPAVADSGDGTDGEAGDGAGDGAATRSSGSSRVDYASLAATAERQAGLRGPDTAKPRATGDVRAGQTVTWWRVPMLRRVAGITRTSGLLGYTVAIAALCWFLGADTVPGGPRAAAVLTGIAGCWSAWRMFRSGIPLARRTARAATAPESRTRRYVLLFDVNDANAGPLLMLFPAGAAGEEPDPGVVADGGDALPEGLLRIMPPGPDKCPWAGLPAATGTVELRGWLDEEPVAVAWIEGRAYWPQDPYQAIDRSDPEALEAVAELLPGPM
ncbi:hypothetical protein ACFC5Z_40600 [Streptomyces sp. NPDC056004]|uniref:hypothetical protein n=1 Tax=Streptomyces sp. NPDC056004 TaxID=3345677 RepID=UPI0035DD5FBD